MGLNNKPKVLIFTDWFEPGYKAGGPIRSVTNLVKALGDKIDFFVVTGDRDFGDNKPYEGITTGSWIKGENFKVLYVPSNVFKLNYFWKLLKEQNYDSVYLNSLFSLSYTLTPLFLLKSKNKIKTVLAPRGMLGRGALEIKSIKKKLFLSVAGLSGLFNKVWWHATSNEEKNEILGAFNTPKVFNIPNISKACASTAMKIDKKEGKPKFVFISRLSIKKNLLFILDVFNELDIRDEEVVFDVYGPVEDPGYWKRCNTEIKRLASKIEINYRGELSYDEVLGVLNEYHFFILPTKNENYGHAIVEAGLAGCVPIISNQTPWKDLEENKAGWDISLNNKSHFLEVIKKCIEMPNENYQRLSKSCKAYFLSKVRDDKILGAYYEMFKR